MDEILLEEETASIYMVSTEELAKRREELKRLLEKYQHNKTNISPEDLKGKYKKPWNRLRDDICNAIQTYAKPILFSIAKQYVVIDKLADQRDIILQSIMDELGKKLKKAVWEQASIIEVDNVIMREKEIVFLRLEEFIAPYTVEYDDFSFNVALGAIKKSGDIFWTIPTYR